jgi:hypothetical protein
MPLQVTRGFNANTLATVDLEVIPPACAEVVAKQQCGEDSGVSS